RCANVAGNRRRADASDPAMSFCSWTRVRQSPRQRWCAVTVAASQCHRGVASPSPPLEERDGERRPIVRIVKHDGYTTLELFAGQASVCFQILRLGFADDISRKGRGRRSFVPLKRFEIIAD